MVVPSARMFVQRIRRDGQIEEATAGAELRAGDIVAVVGPREVMVEVARQGSAGGRGSDAAQRRAGRGRGCLRHEQGREQ